MDAQLPAQLVETLVPSCPFCSRDLGQEMAKTIGEKVGEEGFEQAKALWDELH